MRIFTSYCHLAQTLKPLQQLLSSMNAVISTNERAWILTGHVTFKLRYNQIYQMKTTNCAAPFVERFLNKWWKSLLILKLPELAVKNGPFKSTLSWYSNLFVNVLKGMIKILQKNLLFVQNVHKLMQRNIFYQLTNSTPHFLQRGILESWDLQCSFLKK